MSMSLFDWGTILKRSAALVMATGVLVACAATQAEEVETSEAAQTRRSACAVSGVSVPSYSSLKPCPG